MSTGRDEASGDQRPRGRAPLDVVDDRAGSGVVEDVYLVARAQEGYLGAFEQLVRRHQQRAYVLAVRMLGDAHEAEDVVQEAFVKAWRALPGFAGEAAFSTWLHRIVVNECLSHQRRRRPVPTPEDVSVAAAGSTQQQVEDASREEVLRRYVQQLPDDLRAALVLTTFAGHSYEAAAQVLGVSEATVRGRIARARKLLVLAMRGWE